ncbi:hypothetical protein BaRGS_00039879 [Batillaria attramentaria]|uniref:Uncharacterized protein n=1 Tax=Batillaria attramentaria TaxID=370345 RepID=A0ABD0J1S9_9CAEN
MSAPWPHPPQGRAPPQGTICCCSSVRDERISARAPPDGTQLRRPGPYKSAIIRPCQPVTIYRGWRRHVGSRESTSMATGQARGNAISFDHSPLVCQLSAG